MCFFLHASAASKKKLKALAAYELVPCCANHSMESFITSYGLPFHDFQELLRNTGAVIAGSSALALYFKQEGIDPGFVPNDLDIFIRRECPCDQCNPLVKFVRKHGFEKTDKFDRFAIAAENARAYYLSMGGIKNVVSYINGDQKEVQIISLEPKGDVKDYITGHFDLSICATWWDGDKFHTIDSELTKRKIMYRLTEPDMKSDMGYAESKVEGRIDKYILRGFRIIPNRRAVIDEREVLRNYSNISAYDMMTLEDIPLADFLLKSPSNIILKVKEQYFAFNRKTLIDYMTQKRTFINDWVGYIFETPFRQYLSAANMGLVNYEMFRIYELCDESSVPVARGMVSIYDVKAFSVRTWLNTGIVG